VSEAGMPPITRLANHNAPDLLFDSGLFAGFWQKSKDKDKKTMNLY
jgi:hypothetical protein